MPLRLFVSFLLIVCYCFACSDEASEPVKPINTDTANAQTFFPVTDYIRGQLAEIDSLPITPLKIITVNGKVDSIWMKKEDIRPFAQSFLSPEIDTSNFKKLFIEKSFLDQTINAYTFSYDPINNLPDTLQLRRWDVYIDAKKNTIKRIFIVKEQKLNSYLQTQQLTWKSGQWCKITTITQQDDKQAMIKEELMKWDFSDNP